MRCRSRILVGLAVLAFAVSCGDASANPYEEPTPEPISTLAEIREAIATPMAGNYETMKYANDLEHMWDGRRDLLLEAMNGQNGFLAWSAMLGLAAIGDQESAEILRSVLADTSHSLRRRRDAATALGRMGDEESVAALRQLQIESSVDGIIYEGVAKLAADRAERPDRMTPLIVRGPHFLEFRFLLDDISSIHALDGASVYVSSGVTYAVSESGKSRRAELPAEDYAHICELLQAGDIYHPHSLSYDEYLVFQLNDGREMVLTRDQTTFWAHDSDLAELASPWFAVRSETLAAYIDKAWQLGSSGE